MIRKITLLFLACLGMHYASYSQQCGFDELHNRLMSQNSAYAQHVNQVNSYIAAQTNPNALLTTLPNGKTAYEIPVVVHVMYTNEKTAYNVSDAKIQRMIDYLSASFQADWAGYPDTTNGGTRIPLVFKLAQRTPNCTSTNGIIRTEITSTQDTAYYNNGIELSTGAGTPEINVKNLSRWPVTEYYNIWIVNKIDGADGLPGTSGPYTAGYAYLPWATNPNIDGTVVLASQVDSGKSTITHELGHAMGLYHTFQGDAGGASCPPTTNCVNTGDLVCDTEPHKRSPFNCPSGTNPCTGNSYNNVTHNFMDYSNCKDRFTPGQMQRMMLMFLSLRGDLITSLGATPLSTSSSPTVCVPTYLNTSSPLNFGPRTIMIHHQNTGDTLMNVTTGGYVDDGNAVYLDRTCEHMVTLAVDSSYDLSILTGPGEKTRVYIDYNNDGILGNSNGETINLNNSNPHTTTFTVPNSTNVTQCVPIRMRVISDVLTGNIDSCGPISYGQAEDYLVLIKGTNAATSGSVSISNPPIGGNPSCFGTGLTFIATPGSGSAVPSGYQWYINSTAKAGETDDTISRSDFNDDDTVKVKMYFSNLCGLDSVWSNEVVVQRVTSVAPQVTIGVTGGTLPTCFDDTVTFAVTGNVNPGGAPTYYWTANGTPIPGATGTTFKAYQLTANTQIRAVMHSSAGSPCASPDSAISNAMTITYTTKTPTVNIALTVGTNPGCAGQILQFTATPTVGGTTPLYQWYVNGSPVTGVTTSNTYSTGTLNDGDKVACRLTSSSLCASPSTVPSNEIEIIHQTITADITIAVAIGGNPACQGKPVTFSANTTNAGANPNFQWLVNGTAVTGATSPIFATSSLANNDEVKCVLIATDPCVDNPLDTSAGIVMTITPSKVPSVRIEITKGKNPGCLDSLIEFTAIDSNLGTNPNFVWLINNTPIFPGATFSTTGLLDGNTVAVRANQTDGACYLPDTVYSAQIVMKRTKTPNPPIISLIGNQMITNISGSFIWYGPSGQLTGGENGVYEPKELGPYYAVTNDNECYSLPSNVLTITLLDVQSLSMNDMKVYPNPTSGQLILDWKGKAVTMDIKVTDALGKVVMVDNIKNESRKSLNLEQLANGIYYIMLTDDEGKMGTIRVTLNK